MRKFLLATTAMAAVAGFTSAANAQLTVTLGGYTEFFAAIYDNNLPGGTEREFELETEIVVKADGKADNGLLYGAKVELQNSVPTLSSTGVGTDEASVYVGGNWGRFDLGDEDGVADRMAIYAPLVGVEGIDGDYGDFVNVTVPAGNGTRTGLNLGRQPWGAPSTGAAKAPDSGDATKIGYVTPRFAGIQLGFSYAPENASEAQDVVSLKNSASYSDFLEFGINYTGEFSGFTVAASATGTNGNGRNASVTAPALKDFTAWQVGARVGYGDFKLGGGYVDAGNFNVPVGTDSGDQHSWNVGATYTAGPIAVGVSYLDAEGYKAAAVFGTGTYADSYQAYGLSAAYTVAPGFILQSDLMFPNEELKRNPVAAASTKVDNDGYVWLVSTRLNF
jgi:outer membrane protein OmpU